MQASSAALLEFPHPVVGARVPELLGSLEVCQIFRRAMHSLRQRLRLSWRTLHVAIIFGVTQSLV